MSRTPAPTTPPASGAMLEAALIYAAQGYRILPLHTPRRDHAGTIIGCDCGAPRCDGDPKSNAWGKHPRIDAWQRDATTDPAILRGWWAKWPQAQIGLACGPDSGVWVLDIDGEAGEQSFLQMEAAHGPVPATRTIRTGSGGRQMYFRYPDTGKIGQRSGVFIKDSHIDVRGVGGQVVAPPSWNRNGAYTVCDDDEIVSAPEWLIRLCEPRDSVAPEQRGMWSAPPVGAEADATAKRLWAYLQKGCAELAAMGPNSGRNETLNRLAHRAAGLLAAAPVLNAAEVQEMILSAAIAAGLSPGEARGTLNSGWRSGDAKPWSLPDRAAPKGRGRPRVARDNLGAPVADSSPPEMPEPPPFEDADAPAGTPSGTPHAEEPRADAPRRAKKAPPRPETEPDGGKPPPGTNDAPRAGNGDGQGKAVPPGRSAPVAADGWEPVRLTDLGNARRLKDAHGSDFRSLLNGKNTADRQSWLVWKDGRWVYDDCRQINAWALHVPAMIRKEAEQIEGDDEESVALREAYEKWANKSESFNAQRALIGMAQGLPGVTINTSDLDSDPMLLNCKNGTLNLKDGSFRTHSRADCLTKQIRAVYDEDAECPQWLAFLDKIMGGDADMVQYLQVAVGYSLTGAIDSQCMFVMYGNGSNGKSTFIDTIKFMMNDYAGLAAAQTFAEKRDSQIPNDIAKLAGLRLVLASEPKAGSVLEESLIKQVTGDAQLTARYLNQEFFDFTPQFKVWMATNHKPIIKGTNYAIWRRVHLIPFEVTITNEEKIQGFDAILRGEVSGILRWAIEGLARWLDAGKKLHMPGKVADATAAYRAEMDRLGEFFDDCCDLTDKSATCPGTDLYRVYVAWSKDREEDPMSQRAFSQVLQERGYRQAPSRADGRRWQAIRLTRQPPPSATDRQQSYAGRWGRA